MPLLPLIEYEDAAPEVRAVYDDIMNTRGTDWVNNFWKVLANHPETLARVLGRREERDEAGCARSSRQENDLRGGECDQQLRSTAFTAIPPGRGPRA